MAQTESDALDVPDAVDGEESTHSQAETELFTSRFHLEFRCRNSSESKMDNTSVIGSWALPREAGLCEWSIPMIDSPAHRYTFALELPPTRQRLRMERFPQG